MIRVLFCLLILIPSLADAAGVTRSYSDGVVHGTSEGTALIPTGALTITTQASVTRTVLRDGNTKGTEPDRFDRPTCVQRADGVWVMVYRRGYHHYEDEQESLISIVFLKPDGTWTADDTCLDGSPVSGLPSTATPGADGTGPSEADLYLCPNGDLLIHTWDVNYGISNNGTWQTRSTDGGETWGSWSMVEWIDWPLDDRLVEATEDSFIYDGVLYAAARYQPSLSITSHLGGIFVKTDDNGITWDYVSTITSTNGSEFSLEYLGGNDIVTWIRDKNNCYTWISFSDDFGATWDTPLRVDEDLGGTHTNFYRVRTYTDSHLKGRDNWWNDPLIINNGFHNTVQCQSSDTRRPGIVLSEDQLATFTEVQFVDDAAPEDAGYGDLYYNDYNNMYGFCAYWGQMTKSDIVEYQFEVEW